MTQNNPNPTPATPATGDASLPHREADDTEQVFYEGSPLLRGQLGKYILWIIFGVLLLLSPIAWRVFRSQHEWFSPWWVNLVLVVAGLILMYLPVLWTKTITYRITNYRIDFTRGLLARRSDTIELWHIEEPELYQSLLDRVLGVGTITIISKHPTVPRLAMGSLPHPTELFRALEQRIIAVKRQRGVIKMDTGT